MGHQELKLGKEPVQGILLPLAVDDDRGGEISPSLRKTALYLIKQLIKPLSAFYTDGKSLPAGEIALGPDGDGGSIP